MMVNGYRWNTAACPFDNSFLAWLMCIGYNGCLLASRIKTLAIMDKLA
jgi:hypothetical protein